MPSAEDIVVEPRSLYGVVNDGTTGGQPHDGHAFGCSALGSSRSDALNHLVLSGCDGLQSRVTSALENQPPGCCINLEEHRLLYGDAREISRSECGLNFWLLAVVKQYR